MRVLSWICVRLGQGSLVFFCGKEREEMKIDEASAQGVSMLWGRLFCCFFGGSEGGF